MRTGIFIFVLLLNRIFISAQVYDFNEKFALDSRVNETSGLLFLNGKIITHNDSGDAANLYELDTNTGSILRIVSVSNANHVDWEDIAESDTHIFVGDFGNNNGNRTDLTIYKVLKTDFLENDTVTAEIIRFSYEDQNNFSNPTNGHNFDAESLVFYNNELLIFTKNWQDFNTNVYKIPSDSGTYVAEKVSSANVQGLITGATRVEEKILLCGYTTAAIPFLIYIAPGNTSSFDIFQNGFESYNLLSELGFGSQIEGITVVSSGQFYLSRETLSNQVFNLPAALFEFKDDRLTLSTSSEEPITIQFYPNPTADYFRIDSPLDILQTRVYNLLGKEVVQSTRNSDINVSNLPKGMYVVKVTLDGNKTLQKKLIKL